MQKLLGKIVSKLVPGHFLLGPRLGKWYERNPHHKYSEGDILILKKRNIFGYGTRPVVVVNNYQVGEDEFGVSGKYSVTMHSDQGQNLDGWDQWKDENKVPQGIERCVKEQTHFKWNLEHDFRRVLCKTVDEALALYASQEIPNPTQEVLV